MIGSLILMVMVSLAGGSTPPPKGYMVIVNEGNPMQDASASQISALFLRRQQVWTDGRPVVPVDQVAKSPVRQAFSVDIHGRPVQAVQAFWRQKVFAGESVPPAELSSDGEVVEYVRTHADAIGYVAIGSGVGTGVHAVAVR